MKKSRRMSAWGLVLVLVMSFAGCTPNPPDPQVSVTRGVRCTPMPEGRTAAAAFVIGDCVYVFGGRSCDGHATSSLFCYNTVTDKWTCFSTPLKPRVNACAVGNDTVAFLGLGFNGKVYNDTSYLRDWWQFNPSDNSFVQLTDYPNMNTVGCVPYLLGDTVYALFGFSHGFSRDNMRYSLSGGTWTPTSRYVSPPPARCGAVGCVQNGKAFIGGGYNTYTLNDFYEVDLPSNTFTRVADLPYAAVNAALAANADSVYLFGGRYWGGDMTGGRVYDAEGMVAVTVRNETVFYGLGETPDGEVLNTWYKIMKR